MAQEANRSQGPMLCTMGCGFYGNPRTNGMCSVCYKEHLQRQNAGGRLSPTATSPGNGGAVAVAQAAADSLAAAASSTATATVAATVAVAAAASASSPSSVAPATGGSASPSPAPSPSPSLSSVATVAAAAASSAAMMSGVTASPGSAMVTLARGDGSPATTPPPQQEPSQAEAPSPGAPGSPSSPITSQPSPVSSRMTAMTLVGDSEDVVTTDQPVAAAAASADLSACTLVDLDGAEGSLDGADKPRQQKKNRCHTCRKKVGLTGFECRCGNLFCGLHRYSDKHECSYDYKSEAAEKIRKENPIVVSEKIQKI